MVRRTEIDVDRELPPLNSILHHVDFDANVIENVEDEARALALRVLNGSFHDRGKAARELDLRMRHVTGMAKARHVAAMVRMLAGAGKQVLVGAWHRDVYDELLMHLDAFNPVMYTGSETPARKRKSKQAFVAGDARVMLISLRSGAGLDGLQDVCSTAVLAELDWSPQVHKQLFGRLRRPGQRFPVDAIYCHTNGGSDPPMVELLGLKSAQSHGIVDPYSAAPSRPASDDSRMRMLAKQVLGQGADVEDYLVKIARETDYAHAN